MCTCVPRTMKVCGCGCSRHFYTKGEKLERLETYKNQLEKELEGVDAEIERLQQ